MPHNRRRNPAGALLPGGRGETGRRSRLKICFPRGSVGSSPAVRTTRSDNLLQVTQLHLWRGDRHLLKGLDFSVAAGELLQLLWPNGTGKTSLLRCLAGFVHAEE